MTFLILQPTPLQQFFYNFAHFCASVETVVNPLCWIVGTASLVGLFISWWIGSLDKARLFGKTGTIAVASGSFLYTLVAVSIYSAGLCLI